MEFSLPITVYLEDTDAGGIVYHANYLKYMERARTEYLVQLGFPKPALIEEGLLLVVHSINIQYLSAAQLSDRLQVGVKLNKLARTYVEFEQFITKTDEDAPVLCRALIKIACVDNQTLKPKALPQPLCAVLQ